MPKASEVAQELRKLADALDQEPETVVPAATIHFSCKYEIHAKELFLSLARILPRPFKKSIQSFDSEGLELGYTSPAAYIYADVQRSKVCKLIEKEKIIPAVYDCEPLLSIEEERSLA